jgi:sugar phosphate isomerase/epimerase|tara:strand:- start:259 stop:1140 length:882 start_codon:yes stop_codon:yes gene_type:complete
MRKGILMLLGVAGLVPGDWKSIDGAVLDNVAQHGFKTVQIRVDDPQSIKDKDIVRLKSMFDSRGFPMPQTVGNYGGDLIAEDENVRKNEIKFVKRMINVSSRLGSPNTYLRPGSLNPKGGWTPHPKNHSTEVWDRLVDSTKQICDVAENEGMMIAVEGGTVCPVDTPQKMKDLIDDVGSKNLGLNMDPVNFIGSLDIAYDTTSLINEFYALIPDRILGAHAKDFTVVDSLLPHFEESIIGQPESMLDNEALLLGLQKVNPKAHVLVEHLPDDKIPLAATGIRDIAERIGIKWD